MQIEIKAVNADSQEFEDFINLPAKLYEASTLTQDKSEEIAQLQASHPLKDLYKLNAYVGYSDSQAVIRGALVMPRTGKTVYLAYFESIDNLLVMEAFIQELKRVARHYQADQMIGPVNGSFWMGYRMKVSNFDQMPFTGEPHNLAYYPKLWEAVGFVPIESYASYFYQGSDPGVKIDKAGQRYQLMIQRGVQIKSPKRKDWDKIIGEVYQLIHQLYKDFPLFHPLTLKEFRSLFTPLAKALNFSMLTLAYYEDELIGFNIGLPNYHHLAHQEWNLVRLVKFIQTKYWPKSYILLYLGADSRYPGLGMALLYPTLVQIKKRRAQAIAALVHQGKVTGNYLSQYQVDQTEYRLYRLTI